MQAVPTMHEVRAAAAPPAQQGQITAETISRYLMDIRPRIKATTYRGYATCLHVFGAWLESQHISRPTASDILAYKLHLEDAGIAATSRSQYMRLVKAFFGWTASADIYPDIALHVAGVKLQAYTHHRDALDPEAVQTIAKHIDTSTTTGKRLYAIFLLCISCGLRMIEVSRARIQDMRTKDGRRYLYVQGKGHDEPDTPVLLPVEVVTAIDTYLADLDPCCRLPRAPLFASTSNRSKWRRIAPSTIGAQIKAAMTAAGYDSSRITAHSLRHTSGTAVYQATHNIYLTQQHQRHVDPKTTEIYVHADDRATRTTEDIALDYLMHNAADQDPRRQAADIISRMPQDKITAAVSILRALTT